VKIVNLASRSDTLFKAAAACHPAMVDPADAPQVTIPIAVLPSQDEDKDAIAKYESGLKVKHIIKTFPDQVHGWMAARCVRSYRIFPTLIALDLTWKTTR
jgi:dienelactone hydrolase